MSKQQHIMIVGAYGGIGQALVKLLAATDAKYVLIGRDEDKLSALAAEADCDYECCDATDLAAIEDCFARRQQQHGEITGVVNLAGSILLKPCHLLTMNDWEKTLQINLTTAFVVARAAAKCMLTSGGSVVLLSTAAAELGMPNHEAIAAAKAGVVGLMRSAAATYAKNNLRFNCVAPGLVDTPLSAAITSHHNALAISLKMHPLGRIGRPADIARMLAFLLHPENDWITGQVIAVDGGLSSLKTIS